MHSEEKISEYEYYATEPVHISQYKTEFSELLKLFRLRNPKKVLELGTHYGGTLYQWIKNSSRDATIVTVDDYQLNQDMYKDWLDGQYLFTHLGKTQDEKIINAVRTHGPYDFIFIDADHSYSGSKADWENYGAMTHKGSLVAFHDIMPHPNTEVDQLWKEIKDHYIHWEFIEDPTQEGCGIGVLMI